MSTLPLVSVKIPTTAKEIDILSQCVNAVKNSTYKNVEVIVVNEGKERSAQRNIGIDRARGDYIFILDSDQIITAGLIEELVRLNCIACYIPERIATKGFFGYLRNWERQFYTGTAVDCVRFVKTSYCPRFNESMSGPEDSDWDRRIPNERHDRYISKRYLYHKDNIGVLDYFRKKAYYAKSMKLFEEMYPDDKVLNFCWRCFGVYFESGKWKRVLLRPDLFILVCLINFIRGVIYVANKNV